MSTDITAPNEGSATTPGGIADELNAACEHLRVVDYNALTPDQLGAVLDAYHTLNGLCHAYRKRQTRERSQDSSDDREGREVATASSRELPIAVAGDAPAAVGDLLDAVEAGRRQLVVTDTITDPPEVVADSGEAVVAAVTQPSNDTNSESEESHD